jgi:cellulose synthase/poly-beta-1,6-N-acetylglucosamine synthase-like glycosyltransferase
MTHPWFEIPLFVCVWLIVYHHLIYPVLLSGIGQYRRGLQNPSKTAPADAALPSMTVIVPAYNEAAVIEEKIVNLAALDYPRDRVDIVVAIDGARDATKPLAEAAIARLGAATPIRLVDYPKNIGKVAVLNDRIAAAKTDIVVLNDASATIEPDGLRKAAAHFTDHSVGVVFATYRLREAGSEGERAYTDFQTTLKANEGALDSPMGGHGALYFFRRALWTPLAPDTINDDFILPMQIVADGARGVYDETIVAFELERTRLDQEFRRRVRIGAGNLQQAVRLWRLADPRRPWLAFTFLSGKGSRPFMPFVFLLVVVLTALLAFRYGSAAYAALLFAEIATLLLGVVVIAVRSPATPRLLAWLGYLVEGHYASLLGALRVLTQRRVQGWQPSTSQEPSP